MTRFRPVATLACASLLSTLLGVAGCSPGPSVPGTPPPPPPVGSAPPQPPAPPPSPPTLQVLAAGNASSPPSLTAVTSGQRVVIDTVQALHPAAQPSFQGMRLSQPGTQAADALLGWQRASGELVLVPQPAAAASGVTAGNGDRRTLRLVRVANTTIDDSDQVLVFLVSSLVVLPDVVQAAVADGRVLTLTVPGGAQRVTVRNLGPAAVTLRGGETLQIMAVKELRTWLVIGKG